VLEESSKRVLLSLTSGNMQSTKVRNKKKSSDFYITIKDMFVCFPTVTWTENNS